MVQNAIVTVCFHACHHVRTGCIPDVGVSVSRTKHPQPVKPWCQKASLAENTGNTGSCPYIYSNNTPNTIAAAAAAAAEAAGEGEGEG